MKFARVKFNFAPSQVCFAHFDKVDNVKWNQKHIIGIILLTQNHIHMYVRLLLKRCISAMYEKTVLNLRYSITDIDILIRLIPMYRQCMQIESQYKFLNFDLKLQQIVIFFKFNLIKMGSRFRLGFYFENFKKGFSQQGYICTSVANRVIGRICKEKLALVLVPLDEYKSTNKMFHICVRFSKFSPNEFGTFERKNLGVIKRTFSGRSAKAFIRGFADFCSAQKAVPSSRVTHSACIQLN